MKRFILAVMLVLTVSCLMSFSTCTKVADELPMYKAEQVMAPTALLTVTVLPDGSHKVDWALDGDGRTIRSYNIVYWYKKGDVRVAAGAIRLTNTAQFPLIPTTGTFTWNPWTGNKNQKIVYALSVCVFSSETDPTQSDCYWGENVSLSRK